MTGRVAGKKAFVTGAAQGLGAAMAQALAREGAKVSLADINFTGAQTVAQQINKDQGGELTFAFALDVTQEDQWVRALEMASEAMGGISVLINDAGIGVGGDVEELSYAEWRRIMAVNLDSVFLGTKHALPYMRRSQPGSIINLSSLSGLLPSGLSGPYTVSKAGVWMYSKVTALYCAEKKLNIRCNAILPSFMDTPILQPLRDSMGEQAFNDMIVSQIPLGVIGKPADIANAAVFLASDESRFITGIELKVDGGKSSRA